MDMDSKLDQAAHQPDVPSDGEIAEEWTRPISGRGVRRGPQLGALRGSFSGAFIVGALAATLVVGAAFQPAGSAGPGGAGSGGSGALVLPDGRATDKPGLPTDAVEAAGYGKTPASPGPQDDVALPTEPTGNEAPKAEPTPTPKPTVKPTVKPASTTISLSLAIKDGHPYASWSACEGIEFAWYKVVRSTDSTVRWPAGDNDKVVAAIKPGSKRAAWDSTAPAGKKTWYRVFCVTASSSVARSSAAVGIQTPAAPPAPTSCSISLTVNPAEKGMTQTTDGQAVALDWTACKSSGLVYYKVVRSAQSNPSYLPWTDGSVVIAVVGPDGATAHVDHVDGGTWYYRVQAIGSVDGAKKVLGQTAVVPVTVP
jgi:hypothetical protein